MNAQSVEVAVEFFTGAEFPIHQQGQLAMIHQEAKFADVIRGVSETGKAQTFTLDDEKGIVIDGTGAPASLDMTVVVTGSGITAFGKTGQVAVPKEADTVDASGQFMIPGLRDMHVHLNMRPELPAMCLANGVTGVRTMWGWPSELEQREKAEVFVTRIRTERGEF